MYKMESRRLERLVHMITLLEGGYKKWPAGDLADYFAISERTLHRDRHIMENIDVTLYYDPQKKTYYILNTYFPPLNLQEMKPLLFLLLHAPINQKIHPIKKN